MDTLFRNSTVWKIFTSYLRGAVGASFSDNYFLLVPHFGRKLDARKESLCFQRKTYFQKEHRQMSIADETTNLQGSVTNVQADMDLHWLLNIHSSFQETFDKLLIDMYRNHTAWMQRKTFIYT